MLLVLLMLQLMPAPTGEVLADALSEVQAEQEAAYLRMESIPASFTLVQRTAAPQVLSPEAFSLSAWSSSDATGLTESFHDPLPAGIRLAGGEANVRPAPSRIAVIDTPRSVSTYLLGNMTYTASVLDHTMLASGGTDFPEPPSNPNIPEPPGGPGGIGGPGGGIGSPVPEPAAISLLAMAFPLILRRRSRRQNPANPAR